MEVVGELAHIGDAENKDCRLSKCEVCGANDAKYTCPKCEVKTCRLACVNIHKKELECDGIRDRTKFVYARDFSTLDIQNDYNLLEECSRFLHSKQRNIQKRYTHEDKSIPHYMMKLKRVARSRGTVLLFLLEHFSRRRANTTRLTKEGIMWRVEWVFPSATATPLKVVSARCAETARLSSLLHPLFDPQLCQEEQAVREALVYYQAAGLASVRVFLKAERMKACAGKFHELDLQQSLRENLAGKCIVEFPIIYVMLRDHSDHVDIVHSDDEEAPEPPAEATTDNQQKAEPESIATSSYSAPRQRPEYKENTTARFAREERLRIQQEVHQEKKKKPKNLLFVTGYSSDEGDMSCSSG